MRLMMELGWHSSLNTSFRVHLNTDETHTVAVEVTLTVAVIVAATRSHAPLTANSFTPPRERPQRLLRSPFAVGSMRRT